MTAVTSSLTQGAFAKSHLYFANDLDKCLPLPTWGTFFIEIGRWIAQRKINRNYRFVLGLAIPIRNYAAALAALGVVLANSVACRKNIFKDNFERLCSLKKGMPVVYRQGKQWLRAIYEGICNDYSEPRIRVRVKTKPVGARQRQEPETIHLISRKDAHRVKMVQKETVDTISQRKVAPSIIINEFLENCLQGNDTLRFYTQSQLDCLILGRINTLKTEITKISFACSSFNSQVKTRGFLQDVLRVRSFFGTEGQAYRSEVLASQVNIPPQTANGLVPHVTIFDGATGFLKWRDEYRNSHWIVLLERTEARFQEAVTAINKEYINRFGGEDIPNIPSPPPGVDIVVYRQAY